MPAQRVIITGASSGLGKALALRYASRGATLALISRRGDALRSLAADLHTPSEVYAVDVRDSQAMNSAAWDFMEKHGCPDVVIANAGVSTGTLTEHPDDLDAFRAVFDTNVVGMVNTFHPFVLPMRELRRGSLVGIASVAGIRGLPGAGAYSASKAAAMTYLESLRVELSGTGVRVLTICPGYIDTPLTARNPYPMPFLLEADEAAGKIARIIEQGKSRAVIPWQMAIVAGVLKWMPNALYDRLFARAPRKPRGMI